MRLSYGILCALVFATSGAFGADARIDQILGELSQTHTFSAPAISPDARWVSWNEKSSDAADGSTMLAQLNASGSLQGAPHVLVTPGAKSPLVWSPDGTQFVYLAKAEGSQEQVYLGNANGSAPKQVTHITGYLAELRWSPDGKHLSVLFAEGGGGGGPLEAAAAQTGEIGSEVHNQRISSIDLTSGEVRQISPRDQNVYEYDWAPDAKQLVAIAAPGPADNNWWIAKLFRVEADSGAMQLLYAPPATRQIAIPRWSPDGKQIAFVGGLMSDEGFVGGDVFVVPAAGGAERDITKGSKDSATSLRWESGSTLLVDQASRGGGAVVRMEVNSGKTQPIWQGTDALHDAGNFPDLALSADAKTWVAVRSDWQHAPEVWLRTGSEWKAVTRVNADMKPHWGKAENLTWTSGGMLVQGWLLYPQDFDSSKRYPMVVSVHGGPASMRSNSWPSTHFDMSVLAALGYFVFFPNPRGSYGQGEAFTRGNIQDFGGGDLRDIVAGLDEVTKRAPVDNARIGITGWSYGGYMTMWTVTQTHRFHAAVAGAGIANWLSYYGENGIDQWMIPYFGKSVYDDPAVYAKSSPINYIKQVRTPTLILVGESDAECPAPQSFEFWHALHTLGVPTKLVVYPGEGHGFNKDKDQIDRMQRTAEWFNQYLAAEKQAPNRGSIQ